MANFTVDAVIAALSKSLFSSLTCLAYLFAIRFLSGSTSHPLITAAWVWTGIVSFFSVWNYIDRTYANQFPWFSARQRLHWPKQIVLITGGGSGIGALLAKAVAARSAQVVILTKKMPEIETPHERIHTYISDVSRLDEVNEVARKVREQVGNPTIIVNNAAVVQGKLLLDLTEDDISETFGANTLAHFWVLKSFLPSMLDAKKGHIVTMSSIMGLVGAAQMTDYCASKAALVNLHQSLRFELDSRYRAPSIRTTLVLPSFTQTSLFSLAHLPTSRSFNFLAPPVHPHVVVENIISALEDDESRVVRLPSYSNLARVMGDGVGIVPSWMRDLLQWIAGANHAMKEYGPHPDAAERLETQRLTSGSSKE